MKKIFMLSFLSFFFFVPTFAQVDSVESSTQLDSSKTSLINIHLAEGWHKGIRVGGIIFFADHWSAEVSIGDNPAHFFVFLGGIASTQTRYSIGLNWHPERTRPFVVGMSITAVSSLESVVPPNENPFNYLIATADIGLISRKRGFIFFARAGVGPSFKRTKNSYLSEEKPIYRSDGWIFNIDFGVGLNIF
ncbi:MAG TPA: hypothetical protein VGB10_00645 [Bacteroidota bacterium]